MWERAGIIRNKEGLLRAKLKLEKLLQAMRSSNCAHINDCYEAKNMILVSLLIVNAALKRENSIGAPFREDFPKSTYDITTSGAQAQETHQDVSEHGELFVGCFYV